MNEDRARWFLVQGPVSMILFYIHKDHYMIPDPSDVTPWVFCRTAFYLFLWFEFLCLTILHLERFLKFIDRWSMNKIRKELGLEVRPSRLSRMYRRE